MVVVTLKEYKFLTDHDPAEHQFKIWVSWSNDHDMAYVQVPDAQPEDAYALAIANSIEQLMQTHGFIDSGFQVISEEDDTEANARFNAGAKEVRARLTRTDDQNDIAPYTDDRKKMLLIAAVAIVAMGLFGVAMGLSLAMVRR